MEVRTALSSIGRPENPVSNVGAVYIEDAFWLSPPRGLVVRGRYDGSVQSGAHAVLVREDGERIDCIVEAVYIFDSSEDRLSVGLSGLPIDIEPRATDVLEVDAAVGPQSLG
jgi:hypothetical protein